MTRKEFLKAAAVLIGGGAVSGASCPGGGNPDGGNPDAGFCATVASEILLNHVPPDGAHTLTVTRADADAGVDKTYTMQGAADHAHAVLVTAADFALLLTGAQVTVTSGLDPAFTHDHQITLNCV